jgi:replication factor A1
MSTTRGNSYRRAAGPANSNGPRPAAAAAAAPVKLRKPVFTTVDLIKPTMQGINLTARVLSARTILDKTLPDRRIQVSECLVGDGTGTILFTARNLQGTCPPALHLHLPTRFLRSV